MTYEPWKKDEYLIRFEHIMDKTDDPQLSLPYKFNISEIFPGNYQFTEMNLAANQRIEEVNRLHFRQEGSPTNFAATDPVPLKTAKALSGAELEITINPMQIKTFIMSPTTLTTTSAQTREPTAAPTQAPTPAPTSSPSSVGAISENIFKLFPLLVVAMLLKNVL